VKVIRDGADDSRADHGDKTRSVRLMLFKPEKVHHERDHDDAAAHAQDAAQASGDQSDEQNFRQFCSLSFAASTRRPDAPMRSALV